MGIKTVEEARELPERSSIHYERALDPETGRTYMIPLAQEVRAMYIESDDILAFVDTDGRAMQVAWDSGGYYKKPWR